MHRPYEDGSMRRPSVDGTLYRGSRRPSEVGGSLIPAFSSLSTGGATDNGGVSEARTSRRHPSECGPPMAVTFEAPGPLSVLPGSDGNRVGEGDWNSNPSPTGARIRRSSSRVGGAASEELRLSPSPTSSRRGLLRNSDSRTRFGVNLAAMLRSSKDEPAMLAPFLGLEDPTPPRGFERSSASSAIGLKSGGTCDYPAAGFVDPRLQQKSMPGNLDASDGRRIRSVSVCGMTPTPAGAAVDSLATLSSAVGFRRLSTLWGSGKDRPDPISGICYPGGTVSPPPGGGDPHFYGSSAAAGALRPDPMRSEGGEGRGSVITRWLDKRFASPTCHSSQQGQKVEST